MKAGMRRVGLLLMVMVALLGCDASSSGGSNPPQNSAQVVPTSVPATQTTAINTPTSVPRLPTPLGSPTDYPYPTTPTWDPRVPTPKETIDQDNFLPLITPSPQPTIPLPAPRLPAPPTAVTLSNEQINLTTGASPIVWGVETKSSLTIWLGYFSEAPDPAISNAHPIVQWNSLNNLMDLKISPDHRALAIAAQKAPRGEGGPIWLSVIDLNTNSVQPVPNYSSKDYDTFYNNASPSNRNIVGWIDSSRFLIGSSAAIIATRGGAISSSSTSLGANATTLSPDRAKLFSSVTDIRNTGYWLYNVDGGDPQKVVEEKDMKMIYAPEWSPNGRYISFVSPDESNFTKSVFRN